MYNFCAVPTPCDFVYIIPPNLFWCRYPLVCGYFVALLSGIFIDIGPRNKHFSKSNHINYSVLINLSPKDCFELVFIVTEEEFEAKKSFLG